jgi:gliding motility-associated protein GldM
MSGGGKETPRQKMIGMMYLFYTAMLALQVSNSVLERFVFINLSLEKQIITNDAKNSQVLTGIGQAVEKRGNRADDTIILNKAKDVRTETRKVIAYCDSLKNTMVKITGGRDEKGQIVGVKDQDKVANLMINQNKGEELKKVLNNYAALLGQKTGKNIFTPIALDGKDHPIFSHDKDQKVKDFADLFFEETPTAAGMASVSELETEVMEYENRALGELANQVGAKEVRFDKIIVMAKPESNMVAAGTKYKADLFLAASSSQVSPQMSIDGRAVPVVDGFGKVEFTVSGGNYDNEGKAKKSYEAKIFYNDSNYIQNVEYFAVKPVIQIQSGSVQALYLNCGNDLVVLVPALGNSYNPTFTATGADVVPDKSRRGFVTVIPNATKEVVLTVNNGGFVVGSAPPFKVRGIPKPDIIMMVGGKPVDEKNGEKTIPRSISLVAVAEKNFADALPNDARYRVQEWEVMLARGRRQIGQPLTISGPDGNVTSLAAQAQPGDRFVATVKRVERLNFKNNREEVNVGTVVKNLNYNP